MEKRDGIIYVCDFTDQSSLETFKKRIKYYEIDIDNQKCMIFANKCDARDKRVITSEELSQLGISYKMKVVEVSAKTGENVNDSFYEFLKNIYKIE